MHSTDDLFERLFSSVDTRAAFFADGLLSDSSAPAASCSSFLIARQRRLAAKEKLLQDFDQNGVEDVHLSQCRAKCPAAMDVVPMDVKRDTLAFRSKINHSKNALAVSGPPSTHQASTTLFSSHFVVLLLCSPPTLFSSHFVLLLLLRLFPDAYFNNDCIMLRVFRNNHHTKQQPLTVDEPLITMIS